MYAVLGFGKINSYMWMLVLLVFILAIAGILYFKIYRRVAQWLSPKVEATLKVILSLLRGRLGTGDITLDKAIETAGYSYDAKQDIFYSNMDAWQRNLGYCQLYDEAAAPLGMIIDCEPIYFEYGGKRWLIEFWKGQYDLTLGCEIGIYTTTEPDLYIPGVFEGPFYKCASNEDRLKMSYSLKKNDKVLFTRKDKHWWLTGFKLGEFSEPSELKMNLSITLKDLTMRNSFIKGLKDAGYSDNEIVKNGTTVTLKFEKTHTPQPFTRIKETDWIIQRKNELLCEKYQDITSPYDTFPDKIKAIQEQAPKMYEKIINMGKSKLLLETMKKLKND